MALNEDIDLLSRIPLFSGLDRDQLRLIAFGADHVQFLRGDVLFEEGVAADCAYVVAAGRVGLAHRGQELEIVAEPGTLLSELALMTEVERKYDAIALENTDAIRIARVMFHRLIQEYPAMAAVVEDRIRHTIGRLAQEMTALQGRFQ